MRPHGHPLLALAEAAGGHLVQGDGSLHVEHLVLDSRKPLPAEGALFFAIRSARHDGHQHLRDLYTRGVRAFVVQDPAPLLGTDAQVVVVQDSVDALQRMAAWHRAHFHTPVVGITGSNGKTVVKEWLYQILRETTHMVRSPGSWNSQVGVPLSVWNMDATHALGVFEAGISRPGEMERLRTIILPTLGIFTNIGPAHAENFSDDHAKAREKLLLFTSCEALVYCRDHAAVHAAVQEAHLAQRVKLCDWSREGSAWLHVTREDHDRDGAQLTVLHDHRESVFRVPFADAASVENALHGIALLLHLGHDPEWIAGRLLHLGPVAMRLEMVDGVHGSTLINDAYSNDTASLAIALDHLNAIAGERPRVVVLSDILESGEEAAQLYGRVGRLLKRARVDRLIGIGPQLAAHASSLPPGSFHSSAEAMLAEVDAESLREAAVLVKGARTFGLERVVAQWQEKVHGTVLEIDLEAVRHNLDHYRAQVRPGVQLMAMVKAFGYGGGAVELARLFAHHRVHYLGVAYADEGVALRQAGIRLPVMVMNPEPVPWSTLQRFNLEPVVYNERSLREAMAHTRDHAEAPPVHLKIDTGMHRLGFTPDEVPHLVNTLRDAHHLRAASIFSHLAASEAPEHDAFTREQIVQFSAAAEALCAVLPERPLLHLANSAAVKRFPEAQFNMVRLGIGLHGIGADATETALLRPAATLRSPIAQLRTVQPGESVSYGRRHRVATPQRIATLPIGYADGLPRKLGNGHGRMWVQGQAAPFVGSICMDMCMIDVTGINCREGDDAVLFDPAHPVTEVAHDLGTIAYEVLTAISPRVKRVHVHH
ncbi:MAG: bifunctional UDP-N-acetylmuramoyl-tripeptide:D-alanyl-D-alanine ligase/alanine racemase [Flavobacteriales bacterium]|nr:bifunctional UDP-N-acetylmuramoyl-tripeptide:D-alanyl-D-alanine ligase/alanine racemase [Flavobacteriales bacterium]